MKATNTGKSQSSTTPPKANAGSCSCGCQGGAGDGTCTCCNPCCERPNYFCGQLLSDADLSAEQSYVREKQKLYHRSLHGRGVVCGLRLTCDIDCCGHIRIGDGYAIDDCGNDLVVCTRTSFDVIAALKAKDWLVLQPPCDPCEPAKPPRCKVKQCFYVTICYDEQQVDFTTPFKTSCSTGAAVCEPTRIRETVRFDVVECPPKPRSYLGEIEERITRCWKVFEEGPLAIKLREILPELRQKARSDRDYCQMFCQLKVLFQHHLKRHPDLYDCTLWEKICRLECPDDDRGNYERYRECLCTLFELIRSYAYQCMLGEMIFECPCPPRGSCVGLGMVEVEDGKLLSVCNCPRTYVWTFANFFEVFLATVVGGVACAPHEEYGVAKPDADDANNDSQSPRPKNAPHQRTEERGCCATFDFDCDQFMSLLRERPDFGKLAAAAPIHAIRELIESLKTGFNFTDALAFSPGIFKGMTEKSARMLAEKLGGKNILEIVKEPVHFQAPDPIAAVRASLLRRPGDRMVAYTRDDRIVEVIPDLDIAGSSADVGNLANRLRAAEAKSEALQGRLDMTSSDIAALRQKIDDMGKAATPGATGVNEPKESKPGKVK